VYVRAAQGQGYPLLRKVLVSYGNITVLENTLGQALAAVFSEDSPDRPQPEGGDGEGAGGSGGEPTDDAQADLVKAIADAQSAYTAGEQALAGGDFAAYGRAQDDLKAALDRAAAAQRRITGESAAEVPAEEVPPADEAPADEAPADGEAPVDGEVPTTEASQPAAA
jgi:hypothetical protein